MLSDFFSLISFIYGRENKQNKKNTPTLIVFIFCADSYVAILIYKAAFVLVSLPRHHCELSVCNQGTKKGTNSGKERDLN